MRTSAIVALTLALPLMAATGSTQAVAGGWCDRPAAAYYAPPVAYYAPPVATYRYTSRTVRYGYAPRVVGYYAAPSYYAPAYYGSPYYYGGVGYARRGFGFGIGF